MTNNPLPLASRSGHSLPAHLWISGTVLGFLAVSFIQFFRYPLNPPLLTVVFPAFFKAVFAIEWRIPEGFGLGLAFETASLALQGAAGLLFLRLFCSLPLWVEIPAALFVGIGLATFVLELWAIFFLLNKVTILLSLAGLILVLLGLKKRWGWAEPEPPLTAPLRPDRFHRGVYGCAWGMLAFLTALSFYHAVLFPVNYWDALILYIHYGKMTWRQGGFPVLVCLQVGLGLGANYPHLYPLHQAVTATLFGSWSDLYGQLLPPLAGLGSVLVLYYLILRLFPNRLIAILAVLAFRSLPYVTTYFVWASDYALVMLYTVLFMLFLEGFLHRPDWRSAQPLLAVAAIFPHINYLGWIVWPPMLLAFAAAWRGRTPDFSGKRLSAALCFVGFWLALGLTWYVRNWIVTGNPVYAFFPGILGGKNINLEVLASCEREWSAHGNGAGKLGHTLLQKILNTLIEIPRDWRFSPLLLGFLVPAFLLGWRKNQALFFHLGFLLFLLFIYQYMISGLYWYHTIAAFPILGLFAARFLSQVENRWLLAGLCAAILLAALVPGAAFSIMGPKIPHPSLPLFRHPGLSLAEFNRFAFPAEAPIWRQINEELEPGAVLLTHDNRYHVYRDDIRILHLDDCGLTPLYGRPYPEIHRHLLREGVRYYLQIPDEKTHPITQRLGHGAYLNNPDYFERMGKSGEVILYRLKG
ncbi:MAG: hypothetical protein ACE15F_13665 [bacterium]